MKYNIYFDIAAVILNAMLLLSIYLRRTYPSKACLIYKCMLWLNLGSAGMDILSATTISFPENYSLFFNYFV